MLLTKYFLQPSDLSIEKMKPLFLDYYTNRMQEQKSPLTPIFDLNKKNNFVEHGRVRYILLVEPTAAEIHQLTTGFAVGDGETPVFFVQVTPNVFYSTTSYGRQPLSEALARTIFKHDNFMLCAETMDATTALCGLIWDGHQYVYGPRPT